MKKERRTMKRGEVYEIEERERGRDWQVVCRCASINDAKELLKMLQTLDGEEVNDKK